MALDNIFGNKPNKKVGSPLDNIFASKEVPMKEPGPGTPSFTFNTGGPIDIKQISVPQETQTSASTPSVQTNIGPSVDIGAIANTVQHPIVAAGGVVKGATDAALSAFSTVASLSGNKDLSQRINLNKNELNKIFEDNAKSMNATTAAHVGNFVGEQILPILATEGLGLLSDTFAISKIAGTTTLKNAQLIGKAIKGASNVLGFAGTNQLLMPVESTGNDRAKQAIQDVALLGAFEGLGSVISKYKSNKWYEQAKSLTEDVKKGDITPEQIASRVDEINRTALKETGSTPRQLFSSEISGNPINIKEIPPQTKMGDLAQYASNQGFKQYDNAFNGGFDIKSIASTEKPLQAPVANEIPKVDVTPIREKITPASGKVSGVAKQIEQGAIERGLIDKGYENLPEYGASTIKEQASMASKYSIDELTRIAETGNLPSGMKAGTPLSVLEDYAKANNDAALTLKLATSPLTTKISESASELSLSRMRSSTNPVDVIRTVMDDRMKVLEPKISKTVSEIKKSIKQPIPTKESWAKFIDDITC